MKTATDHAREIFTDFSSRKGIRHALDAWDPDDIDSLRGEIISRVECAMAEARQDTLREAIKTAENFNSHLVADSLRIKLAERKADK